MPKDERLDMVTSAHHVFKAFHERGEAAWQHYLRTGLPVPADEVLAKLQAKLNARHKQLGKWRFDVRFT